jgi:rhodanese-related sulfurtransferase
MKTSHLNELKAINAQTLKQWIDQQAVTLIDVREPSEYAGENIPGAKLVALSTFNPKDIPQSDRHKVVLYCQGGNRSPKAAQKLFQAGFKEVTHLSGGISAWKQAGYATQVNRNAPISLMRQVQIVAGSLVLTCTLLGVLVSPSFLIISGFVGAGLLFAGVTDTCMLGMLLAKLPYNQRSHL